jgi:hypothetical protein
MGVHDEHSPKLDIINSPLNGCQICGEIYAILHDLRGNWAIDFSGRYRFSDNTDWAMFAIRALPLQTL